MPKFYGQNKKRIDPRYFLHENTTGYTREEVEHIVDNEIGIDAWHSARHSDAIAKLLVTNFENAKWSGDRKDNLDKVWEFVEFGVIDYNDVSPNHIADAITTKQTGDEYAAEQGVALDPRAAGLQRSNNNVETTGV